MVRLVLAVLGPELDISRTPDLVGEDGEASVLAGAQGIFLEEVVRVTTRGGLAFRGIVPELEPAGVRHEDDLGATQGEHARDFRELVIVADDDAELARADVEDSDLRPPL